MIQRGDVLHCDVGITGRGSTPTPSTSPMSCSRARPTRPGPQACARQLECAAGHPLQEDRPGRTGNEILAASRERIKSKGINGTMYWHPIGLHGHGAGPLIGLWDYQEGVAGRGDAKVIPSMWFSIEPQVTTPAPERNNQPVRMAQEEDFSSAPTASALGDQRAGSAVSDQQ